MKWNQETIKSKVRKFLAEYKFESEDAKPEEDALIYSPPRKSFYNAVKLCVENNYCSVELLQQYFGISTERVMHYIYTMEALELIASAETACERRTVLPAATEFLEYIENITDKEYYELLGCRYFKTNEEYKEYRKRSAEEPFKQCMVEEDMLKEIAYQNGTYHLNGYNNLTWCEVRHSGNVCSTKIFYCNIPGNYRIVDSETYSFTVNCKDDAEAEFCARTLANMIFDGYKIRWNWFCSMDISDLATIFSKEAKFINFGQQPIADIASTIHDIKEEHEVFVYVRVNSRFTEKGFDPSIDSVEESFNAFRDDLWISWMQISLDDDTAAEPFEVVMWYT